MKRPILIILIAIILVVCCVIASLVSYYALNEIERRNIAELEASMKDITELGIKIAVTQPGWEIKDDTDGYIGVYLPTGSKVIGIFEATNLYNRMITELDYDISTMEGYKAVIEYSYDQPISIKESKKFENGYSFTYDRGSINSGFIYFYTFGDKKIICASGGGSTIHFEQSKKVCASMREISKELSEIIDKRSDCTENDIGVVIPVSSEYTCKKGISETGSEGDIYGFLDIKASTFNITLADNEKGALYTPGMCTTVSCDKEEILLDTDKTNLEAIRYLPSEGTSKRYIVGFLKDTNISLGIEYDDMDNRKLNEDELKLISEILSNIKFKE